MSLLARIRDPGILLALAPEELAYDLLAAVGERRQQGSFSRDEISRFTAEYPQALQADVELAITEAWRWLEIRILIVPAPGTNGQNGWFVLSRQGHKLLSQKPRFYDFVTAAAFPRELLHPAIAERVSVALARGEYADAVFFAFRMVEEAVRKAGRYAETDIGVPLMRQAFDARNGPLSKAADPPGEREALCHLFAGAIGSYKNPHSHRTVALTEPLEGQEMVLLASHLLRIVDARWPR